jgi:hypothetical protein
VICIECLRCDECDVLVGHCVLSVMKMSDNLEKDRMRHQRQTRQQY